jgi:membrane protease YdiL (CAAX protease family)
MTMIPSGRDAAGRYPRVASWVHAVVVLGVVGGWAVWQKSRMDRLGAGADPHRVRGYVLGMCFEWALFGLVVAGVWRSGTPLHRVLGERWRSAGQLLKDVGIALGFWVVATGVLWGVGWVLRIRGNGAAITAMLPHGVLEVMVWIALSVSAGICEETIFRGYLQAQFMALTKNAAAGIVLAAAIFGAAHAYQGLRMTILIAVYGLMFGSLAYWRGSVRPGMIAHAWQDSLNGVLGALMRR